VSVTERREGLASPGRRVCAALIDGTCLLGGFAAASGAAVVWAKQRDGSTSQALTDAMERWTAFAKTRRRAGPILSVASAVGLRNWRSPGMRLTGIHREDVRSGGPVTVRGALTRELAGQAHRRVVKVLIGPRLERHQARVQAIQPKVDAARREHPDDTAAEQRAIRQAYRDAGVNPAGYCGAPLVALSAEWLVMLSSPRHQSVVDWVAGIVMVRD
jgi:hypothetical protein